MPPESRAGAGEFLMSEIMMMVVLMITKLMVMMMMMMVILTMAKIRVVMKVVALIHHLQCLFSYDLRVFGLEHTKLHVLHFFLKVSTLTDA